MTPTQNVMHYKKMHVTKICLAPHVHWGSSCEILAEKWSHPSQGVRIQVFKQLPVMTKQVMVLMWHTMTKLGMTTDIFSPGGVCRWNEVVVVGYHPLDAWSNELTFAGHTAAASSLLINANQRQLISEELSAVCVMEGFLAWKLLRQCLQTLKSSFGNRLLLVRALVLNSMDRQTNKDHT